MTSLKKTLTRQLIMVTALIIVIYTLLLYLWFFSGIHFANHSFMKRDSLRYKQWYQQDPTMTLPAHQYFGVYLGFDSLPLEVALLFDQTALVPDKLTIAEVDKTDEQQDDQIVMLMPTRVNNNKRLLYVLNIIKMTPKRDPIADLSKVVAICGVLILVLMVLFAKRLYLMIIKPLDELGQLAKNAASHRVTPNSPVLNSQNEFGLLARTFEQSVNKINLLNRREKTFLENVSHELRTPIAVIKSSLELVNKRIDKGNFDIKQPIGRLTNANQTMQDLTETMLWLARSSNTLAVDSFDFLALTDKVWQELGYLNDKNIRLERVQPMQQHLNAPKELVTIILTNLLRNAIEHNTHNTHNIIVLSFNESKLSISNHSEPLSEQQLEVLLERGHSQQQCFGLGLNIVQQVCLKQGWGVELRHAGDMLSVDISFT